DLDGLLDAAQAVRQDEARAPAALVRLHRGPGELAVLEDRALGEVADLDLDRGRVGVLDLEVERHGLPDLALDLFRALPLRLLVLRHVDLPAGRAREPAVVTAHAAVREVDAQPGLVHARAELRGLEGHNGRQ